MKYWHLPLITVVLVTSAFAQESIFYSDGENRTTPLELQADTALSIASGTATQSGRIEGDYSVTKTGGGTLVLMSEEGNIYGGSTTVEEGILRMGSHLSLAEGHVVVNGGILDLNGYGGTTRSINGTGGIINTGLGGSWYVYSGTFNGSIIGGGPDIHETSTTLIFNGIETLNLGGNNQFQGSLYITSGRIISTGTSSYHDLTFYGGTFEAAGGETTIASTIYVDDSEQAELKVSGGALLQAANHLWIAVGEGSHGTVIVAGSNSRLQVSGNTEVSDSGTGLLLLAEGGKLTAGNGSSTVDLAYGETGIGTLAIGEASGENARAAGLLEAGSVTTSMGSGTLLFNHTESAYAFTRDGTASGTAIQITGLTGVVHENGVTHLTRRNTYSGGTSITGGTLVLDYTGTGSALGTGALEVSENGTLAGNGRVLGHTIIAGTLAPGNSAGQLTFANGLTLESTARVELEIGGTLTGQFDRIVASSGTMVFDGTLNISFIDDFNPADGTTFQVFSFDGSSSGMFDSILFTSPLFSGDFDYATGTLTVWAIPEPSYLGMSALLGGALMLRRRLYGKSR